MDILVYILQTTMTTTTKQQAFIPPGGISYMNSSIPFISIYSLIAYKAYIINIKPRCPSLSFSY